MEIKMTLNDQWKMGLIMDDKSGNTNVIFYDAKSGKELKKFEGIKPDEFKFDPPKPEPQPQKDPEPDEERINISVDELIDQLNSIESDESKIILTNILVKRAKSLKRLECDFACAMLEKDDVDSMNAFENAFIDLSHLSADIAGAFAIENYEEIPDADELDENVKKKKKSKKKKNKLDPNDPTILRFPKRRSIM